jgi:hypothetical protein
MMRSERVICEDLLYSFTSDVVNEHFRNRVDKFQIG